MTNGEKFCIDFPNIRIEVFVSYVQVVGENYEFNNLYPLKWWSAEYKEPTTKNDLGVDCISREQAKEAIRDKFKDLPSRVEINTILNELPSVTPQEPRWIPVSEKLPNDRDWYLGIFKEPDTGWINPLPFICDYVGRETKTTTKDYWCLRGFTDWDDYHIDYYFNLECVAWMPLPQNYEEVEE